MENGIKSRNWQVLKVIFPSHFIQLFWILFNVRLKIRKTDAVFTQNTWHELVFVMLVWFKENLKCNTPSMFVLRLLCFFSSISKSVDTVGRIWTNSCSLLCFHMLQHETMNWLSRQILQTASSLAKWSCYK